MSFSAKDVLRSSSVHVIVAVKQLQNTQIKKILNKYSSVFAKIIYLLLKPFVHEEKYIHRSQLCPTKSYMGTCPSSQQNSCKMGAFCWPLLREQRRTSIHTSILKMDMSLESADFKSAMGDKTRHGEPL